MISSIDYERLMQYYSTHDMPWDDIVALIKGNIKLEDYLKQ